MSKIFMKRRLYWLCPCLVQRRQRRRAASLSSAPRPGSARAPRWWRPNPPFTSSTLTHQCKAPIFFRVINLKLFQGQRIIYFRSQLFFVLSLVIRVSHQGMRRNGLFVTNGLRNFKGVHCSISCHNIIFNFNLSPPPHSTRTFLETRKSGFY